MLKEGVDPLVLVFRLQLASVTSKLQPNNFISSEPPSFEVVLEEDFVVDDEVVVVVVVVTGTVPSVTWYSSTWSRANKFDVPNITLLPK